jgi:restriction endonuclease S subunit
MYFEYIHSEIIDDRIDAQFFTPEYIKSLKKINQFRIETLGNISRRIFDPPHTAPEFVDKSDFEMIMIENITLNGIEGNFRAISETCHKDIFKNSHLEGNELLVSRVGNSSGTFASVFPCYKGKNVSGNISIIKLKDEIIDKEYAFAYFNSNIGQNSIKRNIANTARKFLTISKIREFQVPIPSPEIQKYIGDKVRKAEELREEAKRLKKEVLDRLNTLLFNPNIKIDNNKFLYLDCKEIIDYKIGATIYRPKYVSNRRGLKQGIKLLKLKDISRKIYDGNHGSVHPKNILDEGDIPFIRAQDAHDGLVEINKYISNEEYRLLKHKTINYGDIVYGIKGSVGKGGIYLYENSDATVNPACVVISPKKLVNSGYLIEVLESDYFNNEIYRFAESDSTRPQISRTEFEELEVPMVSEEEQKAIGDLVFRRIKAINQSKQLIQEAKQDVEDLIEGNFDMSKVKANS